MNKLKKTFKWVLVANGFIIVLITALLALLFTINASLTALAGAESLIADKDNPTKSMIVNGVLWEYRLDVQVSLLGNHIEEKLTIGSGRYSFTDTSSGIASKTPGQVMVFAICITLISLGIWIGLLSTIVLLAQYHFNITKPAKLITMADKTKYLAYASSLICLIALISIAFYASLLTIEVTEQFIKLNHQTKLALDNIGQEGSVPKTSLLIVYALLGYMYLSVLSSMHTLCEVGEFIDDDSEQEKTQDVSIDNKIEENPNNVSADSDESIAEKETS